MVKNIVIIFLNSLLKIFKTKLNNSQLKLITINVLIYFNYYNKRYSNIWIFCTFLFLIDTGRDKQNGSGRQAKCNWSIKLNFLNAFNCISYNFFFLCAKQNATKLNAKKNIYFLNILIFIQ